MATFYNRVYSAVYRSFTPFLYKATDYSIDDAGNYSYVSESANTGTTYLGTSRGKDGYREPGLSGEAWTITAPLTRNTTWAPRWSTTRRSA